MKGKWFYYWKKVRGYLSASDYKFISEEDKWKYESEDFHIDICEEWASSVNTDGMNSSFEYGFEEVESPPQEWIDKKILSLQKQIQSNTETINFLKTIKK